MNQATTKGARARRVAAGSAGLAKRALRQPIRHVGRFYSRFVVALKFLLPATALTLLAVVVAWPSVNETPRIRLKADESKSEIVHPRFVGADEKNQPYSLTAGRAEQIPERPGLIGMEKPEAELTDSSGAWVVLSADQGWYHRQDGILRLLGAVHVLRDDGSEFVTDEAYSDVRQGTAWGDRHVEGQGPQGEIVAEGFRMVDRGKQVTFLNRSDAMVASQAAPTTAARPPSGGASSAAAASSVADVPPAVVLPFLPPVKPPVPTAMRD